MQFVRRCNHHAVGPAQLADVVQRGGHGQVTGAGFVHGLGGAIHADQLDQRTVGLFVLGQAQVGQQREDFGAGHVAALELVVGQVEHVGGLLQLGGTRRHTFFQGGVEQLELFGLVSGQAFKPLVLEGLLQHQLQLLVVPGFADVAVDLPVVDRLDDGGQVGVAGEQDAAGGGIQAVDLGQQRGAVHAGHARIAHHQIDRPGRHDLQRLGAAGGQYHVIGLAAQQAAQAVKDRLFIVDQQNNGLRSELFIHGDSAFKLNEVRLN